MCPSSRCEEGALLLGIVQADGTVAFTSDEIRIDAAFVQIAKQGRNPESRFRFSGPCQKKRCAQWTGNRCGVADLVIQEISEAGIAASTLAPNCAIRTKCRWFDQAGDRACYVCPLVITDIDCTDESGSTKI